jgi:hypothetical protein
MEKFVPRAAAVPFVPSAAAAPFVPQVEHEVWSDPIFDINDIINTALSSLTVKDYYIKGGKAYNYYNPDNLIPSSDFDLVATNKVCSELFSRLEEMILGNLVLVDEYEPFYVEHINVTEDKWKDKVVKHGKKINVIHHVRSLSINEIGIVDVIIVDSITEPFTVSENGLHYMDRALFKEDLKNVYIDRKRKINFPGWDRNSDRYKKLFIKYSKSKERLRLFKGKKSRTVRTKKYKK